MARARTTDKRRRILDAAVHVFARKGYFAARVSDVAKKAGVADGTIYLYFQSKEDILVRLFDEVMSEHVEEARAAVHALPSAAERLLAIAERHLTVLGENRDLAAVFQVELRQSTRFMERFTASWLRDYFALLDEVMTAYEAPPETIEESERQRMAELDFHALLASFSPNPLLRFQCRFLIGLLKEITICRRIYRRRIPGFRAAGRDYQSRLIEALRASDGGAARAIMRAHMTAAQRIMEEQESVVLRQFLSESDGADRSMRD